jgi:hypothetical protein
MKTVKRHAKNRRKGGRKPTNNSVTIQITTTRQVLAGVGEALKTGFYGTTLASAGERLMGEGLRALLKDGTIKRAQSIEQ